MKIDLKKAGIIAGGVAGMLTSFSLGLLIKDTAYEKVLDEKDDLIKECINQTEECLDMVEKYSKRNDGLEKSINKLLKLTRINTTRGEYSIEELEEIDDIIKDLKRINNL